MAAFLLAACNSADTSSPTPAPSTTPASPAVVLDGWPGPLRPHLEPTADLKVPLRGAPDPEATESGRCELPEGQPVRWTRSRIRVLTPGRLAITSSATVDAIRLADPSRVSGLSVQDSRTSPLVLEPIAALDLFAKVGGRCLIQPYGARAVWSLPCPSRAIRIDQAPDQQWWLEVACATGEGWFRVDPEAFEVEHYPEEVLRPPKVEPAPVFNLPPGGLPPAPPH